MEVLHQVGRSLSPLVTTPCAPAHPACSLYTGNMEAAGCGPTTSMMSSDYPHLVVDVDIKALLRLMEGPSQLPLLSHTLLTNAPTHVHIHFTHPRIFG